MTVYCRQCDQYYSDQNFNYDVGMCVDCCDNQIKKGSEDDMYEDTGIENNAGVPLTVWVYGMLAGLIKGSFKYGTQRWWENLAQKNIVLFWIGLSSSAFIIVPFICFMFCAMLWLCGQAISFWMV